MWVFPGFCLVLLLCFAFVGFVLLWFLFVLCVLLRVVAIAHGQYLDCVWVHALFWYSQRGDDARCCTIRSTDTNTVLRPGESREGDGRKKKSMRRLSMISQFIHGKDKPVLRPGESHEGVGRKKRNVSFHGFLRWKLWAHTVFTYKCLAPAVSDWECFRSRLFLPLKSRESTAFHTENVSFHESRESMPFHTENISLRLFAAGKSWKHAV